MSDKNELDQTIEELEAEVLAELEEANGDAPKKGAAPAEKGSKVEGEVQDLGGAKPDAKVEKGADEDRKEKDLTAKTKSKEVSGDDQQKGEGKPDAPQKLAAGDEVEMTDEQEVVSEDKKLTKAQHLENIGKMKKADIEEMIANHSAKLAEAENAESEAELKKLEDAKNEIEEKIKSISVKEDVEALVEGEELSEDFKKKAATVFEAAVKSRVRSEVERMDEQYRSEVEAKVSEATEEITEKVDTYLNYVVEEWTKDNELAIERGLKGEIAEDFINGLQQLFTEHYIDVPDEKYDVLEAQSDKIAELENKLNEAIEKSVGLKDANAKLVSESVIVEVSEDLADTEVEKFKELTNDVEFTDEASYREKLGTLKESYFPKATSSDDATTSIDDEETGLAQDIDTTGAMKAYMSAISRVKSA
jgi:hypothetical protein